MRTLERKKKFKKTKILKKTSEENGYVQYIPIPGKLKWRFTVRKLLKLEFISKYLLKFALLNCSSASRKWFSCS